MRSDLEAPASSAEGEDRAASEAEPVAGTASEAEPQAAPAAEAAPAAGEPTPSEAPAAKAGELGATETQRGSTDPSALEVVLSGRTDVGQLREHNEDSLILVRLDDGSRDADQLRRHTLGARGTLLVVCDGMGGAAAGEVASNMAVETLAEVMVDAAVAPPPAAMSDDGLTALARKLRAAAYEANARIFREARENPARAGMGTTMTAAVLSNGHAVVAQVGDSRAYVWRQGELTQVTRDQSLVNQLLETGQITAEQAKFFEHSNVILQALGVQEEVEVQLSRVALRRGDRLMLCSDGLVGVVSDEEIGAALGAIDDPDEAARVLCDLANGAGGPDNITVIVAHVDGAELPAPGPEDALRYALWDIDPAPTVASAAPASGAADRADEEEDEEAARAAAADTGTFEVSRGRLRPAELASMAVVVGLVVGSVVTGVALYGRGVSCRVTADPPGLAVLADGRDSGARTAEAGASLRLRPGRHRLQLSGPGAPSEAQEIEVTDEGSCEVRFAASAPMDERGAW